MRLYKLLILMTYKVVFVRLIDGTIYLLEDKD